MQIVGAKITPYRLPFLTPWQSAAGVWHERQGWLITLTDGASRCGYGDAAPLPEIGTETLPQAEEWLRDRLQRLIAEDPEQACYQLPPNQNHPAARNGLETALLDLLSQQKSVPLHQLLTDTLPGEIQLNANIGVLNEDVDNRAASAIQSGFKTLKLKVGLYPAEVELGHLKQLCQSLPPEIGLRLDANQAWQETEAVIIINGLAGLPIESLEEPLIAPDPESLKRLQTLAPFDLALDESLPQYIQDHQLQETPIKRIIIKPTHLGGILPSLALIKQANQLNINCVITSSLESSAGIWPLLHRAAAADTITGPAVHGLATSNWFAHDLGNLPPITAGRVRLGDGPGSGFILGS